MERATGIEPTSEAWESRNRNRYYVLKAVPCSLANQLIFIPIRRFISVHEEWPRARVGFGDRRARRVQGAALRRVRRREDNCVPLSDAAPGCSLKPRSAFIWDCAA